MVKYQSFSVTFYLCCFTLVLFLNSFGSYTLLTNYNTCISITTCFVTCVCDLPKSLFAHRPLVVAYTLCITIVQRLATRQFTICCLSTYFSAFLRYEASRFVLHLKYYIDIFLPGNLALSRALGDFCFKKNVQKSAEEQIVTGYLFYCI